MDVLNIVFQLRIDTLGVYIPNNSDDQKCSEDNLSIDLKVVDRRWQIVLIQCISKHAQMLS
jgi:hypothetical protein